MSAAYILSITNGILANKGIKRDPPQDMGDGTVITVYRRGKESYAHAHEPGLAAFAGDTLKRICDEFNHITFDEIRKEIEAAGGLWRREQGR